MDKNTLKDISISSCDATYDYCESMQYVVKDDGRNKDIGRVVIPIKKVTSRTNFFILYADRSFKFDSDLCMMIKGKEFSDD